MNDELKELRTKRRRVNRRTVQTFPGSTEGNRKIISKFTPKARVWHLYMHAFHMLV